MNVPSQLRPFEKGSAISWSCIGIIATLSACNLEELSPSPGLHLLLRVDEAQFMEGPLLPPSEEGPRVAIVRQQQAIVQRGESKVTLQGRLTPGGWTVHLQLEGDPDHWVIQANIFDFAFPDELLWRANLAFSRAIPTSTGAVILAQAVDESGLAGPVRRIPYQLELEPPPSRLSVSLGWDSPVDLDLHVVTPDGIDINARNINSFEAPPPGTSTATDAWQRGGRLDFDSNQECVFDGIQVERVLYVEGRPPPGTYRVYAHLFSACGQDGVRFRAVVHEDGVVVADAQSSLFAFDAREHPRDDDAPGLFLLEFEVD